MVESSLVGATDRWWEHIQSDAIRVLHVDDDPAFVDLTASFVDLTASFVDREADRIELDGVHDAEECLGRLDTDRFECIVSDYDMPGMDGLELLEAVRERHARFPFILFTGKGTEEIAGRAIAAGVTDYLQKGGTGVYSVLANRVANAVDQFRSRNDLERFRQAVEHAGHAIYITDADGEIVYVNPVFEDVTGYSAAEAVGHTPRILNSGEHDRAYFDRLWETLADGDVWDEEVVNRRSDGVRYTALQTIAPLRAQGTGVDGYVAIQQDVSEH